MNINVYGNDIWPEAMRRKPPQFRWYHPPGKELVMRWGRYTVAGPRTLPSLHCHDFGEFFWVTHGRGAHLINGRVVEQQAGDVVFIRPSDVHGFDYLPDGGAWGWTNVSMPAAVIRGLQRRYGGEVSRWPWTREGMPLCVNLSAEDIERLSRKVASLPVDTTRRRELDGLITLLLELIEPTHAMQPSGAGGCPPWLTAAVEALDEPGELAEGLPALHRRCGRCPEHVNRVMQRHFGVTATEAVNRRRLDYAARQLRMGDGSILAVAQESGFDNLSYFHRLFRKRFGQTPRHYRLQQGRSVEA